MPHPNATQLAVEWLGALIIILAIGSYVSFHEYALGAEEMLLLMSYSEVNKNFQRERERDKQWR